MTALTHPDTAVDPSAVARPSWVSLIVGVATSAVMLFPSWVGGGGRLPLQNLWHEQTMPEDMPFSLLPQSQYYALSIFVVSLRPTLCAKHHLVTHDHRADHIDALGQVNPFVGERVLVHPARVELRGMAGDMPFVAPCRTHVDDDRAAIQQLRVRRSA